MATPRLTLAEYVLQHLNETKSQSIPGHILPDVAKIDLSDRCTYFYFTDGSGLVWDGDENKAHIIDMAAK